MAGRVGAGGFDRRRQWNAARVGCGGRCAGISPSDERRIMVASPVPGVAGPPETCVGSCWRTPRLSSRGRPRDLCGRGPLGMNRSFGVPQDDKECPSRSLGGHPGHRSGHPGATRRLRHEIRRFPPTFARAGGKIAGSLAIEFHNDWRGCSHRTFNIAVVSRGGLGEKDFVAFPVISGFFRFWPKIRTL